MREFTQELREETIVKAEKKAKQFLLTVLHSMIK